MCSQIWLFPLVVSSSCEWLPMWLHHKIENPKKNQLCTCKIQKRPQKKFLLDQRNERINHVVAYVDIHVCCWITESHKSWASISNLHKRDWDLEILLPFCKPWAFQQQKQLHNTRMSTFVSTNTLSCIRNFWTSRNPWSRCRLKMYKNLMFQGHSQCVVQQWVVNVMPACETPVFLHNGPHWNQSKLEKDVRIERKDWMAASEFDLCAGETKSIVSLQNCLLSLMVFVLLAPFFLLPGFRLKLWYAPGRQRVFIPWKWWCDWGAGRGNHETHIFSAPHLWTDNRCSAEIWNL